MNKQTIPTLIPLQVHPNWAILYNTFYQEEMHILAGEIDNNLAYKEDILSITQVAYLPQKGYQILKEGYWIDLGWYPDSDPAGQYRLVLFENNWENTLVLVQSKQQKKIQAAINQLLYLFYRYPKEQAVQKFHTDFLS